MDIIHICYIFVNYAYMLWACRKSILPRSNIVWCYGRRKAKTINDCDAIVKLKFLFLKKENQYQCVQFMYIYVTTLNKTFLDITFGRKIYICLFSFVDLMHCICIYIGIYLLINFAFLKVWIMKFLLMYFLHTHDKSALQVNLWNYWK